MRPPPPPVTPLPPLPHPHPISSHTPRLSVLSAVPSTRDNPLFLRIRAAVARLVGDRDGSVQAAALKALRPFKLRFLGPHLDRLVKMADDKTLREQLAAFPLAPSTAREGEEGLLDKHRPGLMPGEGGCRVVWIGVYGIWYMEYGIR